MRRGTALLAGLALLVVPACGGSGQGDQGGGKQVEIFSWWTGGGEEAGLRELIKKFEADNKGWEVKNSAVAGGSGTNAQDVLAGRLRAGEPPDSFQGHAGAELLDYIKAGKLEPLDDFYDEHNLRKFLPDQLIDQISVQDKVYSVPVNIHRSNVLWYNPDLLAEAGISAPPRTVDEFIEQLKAIDERSSETIPISLGAQWTADHLLENILLGTLGAEGYNALWKPGADWGSPEVTEALENFAEVLSYAQIEAASTDWQVAARNVVDGKAAFNIMGDWAYGYFTGDLRMRPEEDFGWAASPGTDGVYLWLSDSFTLPKGAPNPDGARRWLEVVAGKEGQDLFNPKKGSIPARIDADTSLYKGYLKWALEEWRSDSTTLAGSFWHGVTANNRWHTDIDTQVGLFLSTALPKLRESQGLAAIGPDIKNFQDGLVTAAENSGQL